MSQYSDLDSFLDAAELQPIQAFMGKGPKGYISSSYDDDFTLADIETLEASFNSNDSSLESSYHVDTFYDAYLGRFEGSPDQSVQHTKEVALFQQLPTEEWNGEDCYDWANDVCRERRLGSSEVSLWNFKNVNGAALKQFSTQHFCAVAGDLYGDVFYQDFQTLRKKESKAARYLQTGGNKDLDSWLLDVDNELASLSSLPSSSSSPNLSSPNTSEAFSSVSPLRSDSPSSLSLNSSSSLYCSNNSWELSQEEFQDLDRYIPQDPSWDPMPEDLLGLKLLNDYNSDEEEIAEPSSYQENFETLSFPSPPESVSCALSQRVKTKSRKGERGPKIWEFLMRLLLDPESNPELIRWDDISKGTFILTQTAVIAQLWGARSKKNILSPNNFARALRYHYNTGALTAVSERHYMYKCGPKALLYLAELKGVPSSATSSSASSSPKCQKKVRGVRRLKKQEKPAIY